ncbi:hypothetical protein ACFFWC_04200 [Plantactinospora siamensis]|uniref:Transposase n=1 Tax=Plantactinospora siamensis TaxID=555372 RepID=A0ABV6NR93_9ACTN
MGATTCSDHTIRRRLADSAKAGIAQQVHALALALAAYDQMIGLRLPDQAVDADAGVVRVRQTFTEVRGVGIVRGPPKSRAGRRAVSAPAAVLPALHERGKKRG